MEQRSKSWFDARLGKFTASEIHKLMGIKGLGKTGESYCFEKAVEKVFGRNEDEQFESFDMKRGIELEPIAFSKFKELKALDFIDVQNTTFFPFGEDSGASPDGLVGNDKCLEIKCPKSVKFFNLVSGGFDEIDKEYFYQMQHQMLCSNSVSCYFFNYLIMNGKEYWHEIEVQRDEETINLMKIRIKEAIEIRNRFIEKLIENRQF